LETDVQASKKVALNVLGPLKNKSQQKYGHLNHRLPPVMSYLYDLDFRNLCYDYALQIMYINLLSLILKKGYRSTSYRRDISTFIDQKVNKHNNFSLYVIFGKRVVVPCALPPSFTQIICHQRGGRRYNGGRNPLSRIRYLAFSLKV